MKKFFLFFFLSLSVINAQFKGEDNKSLDIKGSLVNNNPSSFILGFINPDNFSMNHSFSLSYSAFGGNGLALGVYTNQLNYAFSNKLNLQIETSIVNSPYSTFGDKFSKQINGVYLSKAQLDYSPSKDLHFSIQFRHSPFGYYNPYGYSSFYYDPFSHYFENGK